MLLVVAGCGTPVKTANRRAAALTRDDQKWNPLLQRDDYPDRLGLVMHSVLADHRFTLPWVVVRGSRSSVWFVADRFDSERRFDRIYLCVPSEKPVTASITAYQFGPSDWAILGKLFADLGPEAKSIAREIARRLDDGRPANR